MHITQALINNIVSKPINKQEAVLIYQLTKLLESNKAAAQKNKESK